MFNLLATALIAHALMDNLYGQRSHTVKLIHFRPSQGSLYQNDVITCQVLSRDSLTFHIYESISANIVVRQQLMNGTQVDISTCPLDSESSMSTCSARPIYNFQCKDTMTVTCSVVNIGSNTTEAKTTTQLTVEGTSTVESFYTNYKGVDNYSYTQTFLPGALIQLVCVGNISMVTTQPNKNLTLSLGKGILHSQDPPSVKLLKTWDKECTIRQQVSVFVYVKEEEHLYSEFRCETEPIYTYWRNKGDRKIGKNIRIKTKKGKNFIQGPKFVTTDELEDRTLLSMTCEVMADSTDIKDIRWCIKNENDTQYVSLPLQEKPNDETFNTSFGRKLKSVVLYQLSKSDRNVEIICETNYSKACGYGVLRSSAFFNEYSMEKTSSANPNSETSAATDVMSEHSHVYVATVMIIIGMISLVTGIIAYCKAKQRAKCTNSSSVVNSDVQTTSTALGNLEGKEKQQDQFYENRLMKSVCGSKPAHALNDTHTDAASEMYEVIDENAQDPHIYEEKRNSGELYEDI